MKNKIISLVLAICIMLSTATIVSAEDPVGLTIVSGGQIKAGGSQTVSVTIPANTGVQMLSFCIKYDQTKLKIVSASQGSAITNSYSLATINTNTDAAYGKMYFVWDDEKDAGLTTSGSILDITFKSISESETAEKTSITFDTSEEFIYAKLNGVTLKADQISAVHSGVDLEFEPKGYTITGKTVSWNNDDNISIYLYPSSMTDINIRKDAKKETPVSNIKTNVTIEKSAITSNGKDSTKEQSYEQTFSITVADSGTYKVAIKKNGKYAIPVEKVVVENVDVEIGNIIIYLLGDINNNKAVNMFDQRDLARTIGWASYKNYYDTFPKYVVDINIDGYVNMFDQRELARMIGWQSYKNYYA